jgi:DNA-binding CsgD family transcriptional regulator/tetratricopeptide (TPR) repeat protein
MLLVGTYRGDELSPHVPMREWRARLVTQRLAEEVRLRRLSTAETATMAALITQAPGPIAADLGEAIQRRTDGIPLHVEELLDALTDGGRQPLPDLASIEAVRPPDTLGALVQARLAARSPEAVTVARAAAVIGRSFDVELLGAIVGDAVPDPAAPIAELVDHHVFVPTRVPGEHGFRHALIADAIYDGTPEPDRRRWHARIAAATADRPDLADVAVRSLHLERAGLRAEAYAAAIEAAGAAERVSAHHEALALYQRALRTAPLDLPPATFAATVQAAADHAAAVDRNDLAAALYEQARATWSRAGRPLEAAAVVAPLVAIRHLLGDDLDERVGRLRGALAELDGLPDADPVRARLLAGLAAAYMLDRRLDAAIETSEDARTLARAVGDDATERHAATTLGSSLVFAGRGETGWPLLEEVVETTRPAHLEAEAARGYRMLGSCASVLVEYPRAEGWLRNGIDYAERVEHWNHRHYMAAHLAHVLWATGRWAEAEEVAARSLADGRGGLTTRITALHVQGYLAMGRGDWTRATTILTEARELGTRMRELQRWSPAIWGLAETARLRGDLDAAAELVEAGLVASARVQDAAYLFPFVVTGTRVQLARRDPLAAERWLDRVRPHLERRAIPGTLPALVHARGLLALANGTTRQARVDLAAARDAWLSAGRVWEGWWAGLDLAAVGLRSNRLAVAQAEATAVRAVATPVEGAPFVAAADEILATVTERARAARHGHGDPEPGAADAWAPLTAREFSVARLVADGRTNAAVAEELGISPRTASSHVEHILAKLGVERRAEIAAWVARRPVVDSAPHGDDREE